MGHTELIETKESILDFKRLLNKYDGTLHFTGDVRKPSVPLGMQGTTIDEQMIAAAEPAISSQSEVNLDYSIKNTNRAVGAMLSGAIVQKYGEQGTSRRYH